MPDQDPTLVQLAALTATTQANDRYTREMLSRIEASLNTFIRDDAAHKDKVDVRLDALEDRVSAIESDITWTKRIFMPALGILTGLVSQFASRFLGL